MRYVDVKIQPIDFDYWYASHNLGVVVTTHEDKFPHPLLPKCTAEFSMPVDIRFENNLTHAHGGGENPDMAIFDLASKITGRIIVINAFSSFAKTMIAPKFLVRTCKQVESLED